MYIFGNKTQLRNKKNVYYNYRRRYITVIIKHMLIF